MIVPGSWQPATSLAENAAPCPDFHGDNGAGIGANHQTGWTGCIGRIIQVNGFLTKEMRHDADYQAAMIRGFMPDKSGTKDKRK